MNFIEVDMDLFWLTESHDMLKNCANSYGGLGVLNGVSKDVWIYCLI